ncbi:MAG: tRNA pseudouridine(38-40) synthase TruA [Verrucomicrobiota bacterium]
MKSASSTSSDPALICYKLKISYLGATFAGWQRQKNEVTVQSLLENALEKLWKKPLHLEASGRTDAGVHAIGQVASVQATKKFEPDNLLRALNANLPHPIRVTHVQIKPARFHARFDARAKTYEYRVWNGKVLPPFLLGQALHYTWPLDLAKVQKAIDLFKGEHDFASFTSNPGYARLSTVRRIFDFRIRKQGDLILFQVTANGFLYRMVRNLVGSALHVGDGRLPLKQLESILKACDRKLAPASVPGHGLYLKKVHYGAPYPIKLKVESGKLKMEDEE